jgi:hypothetical protein
VCTVVVRWSEGRPVQVLALRDELTSRGTWCATDVETGATALVLNRPQRQTAAPGAPSRGVLPLLAAAHGADWRTHVRVDGMAAFLLVLATPERLVTWDFDGSGTQEVEHPPGTVLLTSGGPEDRKAERHLARFRSTGHPEGWRRLVQAAPPADDPGALVVRHERDGQVFGTVFGELIEAAPGLLRLEHSREPWAARPWDGLVFDRDTGPRTGAT